MDIRRGLNETQKFERGFSNLNRKIVLLATLFGLLGLLGTFFSYQLKIQNFNITFHWSLIFPLVISLVYGWRYALISFILGGVWLFPFLSWPDNGCANLYNLVQYGSWFVWHGYQSDRNREHPSWKNHVFTAQIVYIILYILPELYIFPLFFHFNSIPWLTGAATSIPDVVVHAIMIKSIFLQFFYINVSYTLLLLKPVKSFFGMRVRKSSAYNGRIILGSAVMGILICQFLTVLNMFFVQNIQTHIITNIFYFQLSLENVVIFLSCLLAGNVFAKFIETRLELENEYRESEKRFRIVFDNARIGIALDDLKNKVTTNNPMIIHNLGYNDEEYNSVTFRDFTHPDDLDQDLIQYEKLRKGELDSYQMEKRYLHKNGDILWGKLTVSTVKGANDEPEYLLTMVEDITEAKLATEKISNLNAELEKRVLERTSELELSNMELESFAYTISHDLRAPLRNINGWSNILIDEFSEELDPIAKKYLGNLCRESIRMAELIDALLELSRVSRVHLKYEPVNMSYISRSILNNLALQEPDRKIEYTVAADLMTEGDSALLRNILYNLIGNAWKFSSHRELSHIEVGSFMMDEQPVFFVKDDGVGFDMRYVDKLFKSFQRLHQMNEFPGSGIGLASVAKIVQRHKGKIWIEGIENVGTTVFFTLNEPTGK